MYMCQKTADFYYHYCTQVTLAVFKTDNIVFAPRLIFVVQVLQHCTKQS